MSGCSTGEDTFYFKIKISNLVLQSVENKCCKVCNKCNFKSLKLRQPLLSSFAFCFRLFYNTFIKVWSQKLEISRAQHICWVRTKMPSSHLFGDLGCLHVFRAQFSNTLAFAGKAWQPNPAFLYRTVWSAVRCQFLFDRSFVNPLGFC